MALVLRIGVSKQGNAERVHNLGALHINSPADRGLDVEGHEIEVVVSLQIVAIEFHVALNLQMLPGFNEGPRRR